MTKVKNNPTKDTKKKQGKVLTPIKKKESTYNEKVNGRNKILKSVAKTLGGCRSYCLTAHREKWVIDGVTFKLSTDELTILNTSKKEQSVYEMLKGLTRHHIKTGNTSPYYLLQCLHNDDKRNRILNLINKIK